MAVNKVWIVRHGETAYNAEHRWQGHLDIELSEKGIAQANQVAQYLQQFPIQAIFSSDLKRCQQTAQPIAKLLNLRVQQDSRLREINLGILQGKTSQQMEAEQPEIMAKWASRDMNYRLPDGESRADLQERMYSAWYDAVATDSVHNLLIVTHGGSIRQLMRRLFDDWQLPTYGIPNTSITHLERDEEVWRLISEGQTPHLIV